MRAEPISIPFEFIALPGDERYKVPLQAKYHDKMREYCKLMKADFLRFVEESNAFINHCPVAERGRATAAYTTRLQQLVAERFDQLGDWQNNFLSEYLAKEFGQMALRSFINNDLRRTQKAQLHGTDEYKRLNAKKQRARVGMVAKKVPIILAAAGAFTGLGLGTAGIGPAAIATSFSLAALKNIPKLWLTIKESMESFKIEEKIFDAAKKDIGVIESAFDEAKAASSKLAKHVTELENLMQVRAQKIKNLKDRVREAQRISELQGIQRADKEKAQQVVDNLVDKYRLLEERNQKGQDLLAKLARFTNDNVPAALSQAAPKTMLGNLQEYMNWIKNPKNGSDIGSDFGTVEGGILKILQTVHAQVN